MTAIGAAPIHPPVRRRRPAAMVPVRRKVIAREDLVRRLMAIPGGSVALLVAPAGYGKSTLLAQWSDGDTGPFPWVRLTPADDDPARLLHLIAAALDSVGPRMRAALAELKDAGGKRGARALARRLVSALASSEESFVLVLDDAHVLRQPETVETLARLVDSLGPRARVALASRTEPALPVARLRTERRLLELRVPDLVLTRGEVARLAATQGLHLDERGADLLARRTEGWAAGVYLASLAAVEDPQPLRAIARFGGDDRLVGDFLREEVLSGMSARELDFLERSSVLDRLSGPLCDHVLGRKDSTRMLRDLSRRNLFLIALDRTGSEYRYQSLLAQALRSELRAREPELEPVLHARASEWYEQHGDTDLAITHALGARDLERAARLVWAETPSRVAYGDSAAPLRWLTRFTRDEIAAWAPLALSSAVVQLALGNRALAEHWAATATGALGADPDPDMLVALHVLRAAVAASDTTSMREEAALAYSLSGEDTVWRPFACLVEGVALQMAGDHETARRRLDEGARRGAALAPSVQVLCLGQLALLALNEDDWDGAEVLAARAHAQTERVGVGEYPTSALVFAASAAVHAHFGRPEPCERDMRQASRLLTKLPDFTPAYRAECCIALAWAALRLSDVPRAHKLLDDAARELRMLPGAKAGQAWLSACRAQSDQVCSVRPSDSEPLTTAELRVLQYLPTHLSFPEIADELLVSTNTVKTHARAVYRKLTANCRSEAVSHARDAGLLDTAA